MIHILHKHRSSEPSLLGPKVKGDTFLGLQQLEVRLATEPPSNHGTDHAMCECSLFMCDLGGLSTCPSCGSVGQELDLARLLQCDEEVKRGLDGVGGDEKTMVLQAVSMGVFKYSLSLHGTPGGSPPRTNEVN